MFLLSTKKQVVFIMTDSTRFDMVGCYGNPDVHTPNLDQLAQEGVRFERAYSCQPVCGPARSAIFTGLYPHSNGSFTNSVALGDNVKTIGQRLRDYDIHTAYIGKWHLDGGDYFGLGRCPDGWDSDYWYDMKCYLDELTPEERLKSRNPNTNKEHIDAAFTYGHRVTNRALDFLEKFHEEDFFMVASYDEPHDPYLCPEPYASMFENYEFPKAPNVWDTLDGKPDYQKAWAGNRRFEDRDALKLTPGYFLGANAYIDAEIGRILDKLKQVAPDAMVIFTSDHGDALQSHCLYAKGPAFYDEIARIPLIIKGGEVGKVNSDPISHIDLLPTVMDYMGLPRPQWIQGNSLMPTVQDVSVRVNDVVFTEFTRYEVDHDGFGGFQPMRSVTDGRYKLSIHLLDPIDELYDLQSDPYEMKNLIFSETHQEIRNTLHDKLLDWMNETRDPFRGYYWERRPWRDDAVSPSWDYTGYTRQREHEEYEPRQLDYCTGLEMTQASRPKERLQPAGPNKG